VPDGESWPHRLDRSRLAAGRARQSGDAAALHSAAFVLGAAWGARSAEAAAQAFELSTDRLLAGYYLNELLLRLMERGDANGFIFSCYSHAVADLAGGAGLARTVRLFELRLLRALGYELVLDHDVGSGEPVQPGSLYVVELELGPRKVERASGENVYEGRHLISLYQEALDDEDSVASARRLLGHALDRYLGGRVMKSRAVLKDILARGLE